LRVPENGNRLPPMTQEATPIAVPKNPAERRVWIIQRLRGRGWTLRALAREVGVAPQTIAACIDAPNANIEPVLAEALGLTPRDVWPERWSPETGRRLAQVRHPRKRRLPHHPTQTAPGGQRQKEHAA